MPDPAHCDYTDLENSDLPPEGVLGVHLTEDESVEIRFDPKRLTDEQVEAYARALAPPKFEHCLFRLNGRACEACAVKLEKRTAVLPGVRKASASFVGGVMSVNFDGGVTDAGSLLNQVRSQGAPAQPWTPEASTADRVEMAFTVITLLAILAGWLAPQTHTVAMVVAFITGGTFGVMAAWQSLKQFTIDVDLLMILAALGAAYVGAPMEGAVLLFLFSLSNVLQSFAIEQTRKAIHSLMKLRPDQALTRRDGKLVLLDLNDLVVGDVVVVRPGESIPLDGVIVAGSTYLDESSLTGESVPVSKTVDHPVFAATINQTGGIEFRVSRLAKDSTIARLVQMVEEAQSEKATAQRWLDQAEQYYAVGVILFTLALIAVPMALGHAFESTFYRAITVMVVASPCALIISTPASILSAIGGAARRGVLFKGGVHLERAGEIDAVAFDKTGTLTVGEPRVTDLVVEGTSISQEEGLTGPATQLLQLAAAVESKSEHPLARAIVLETERRGIVYQDADDFQSISGMGASATVGGRRISVGSPRMFEGRLGLEPVRETLQTLQDQGKTAMLVADEETILGVVAVADVLRSDAVETLKALRELGLKRLVMVTGDNRRVAQAIGREVGVDEVYADLLPEDKVTVLKDLKTKCKVAMVGDGVNDAPALATADVGIAMGAAGTDVALESADVVFMGERLEHLPFAFAISRRARRIVIANLTFSLSVIVVLVGISLFGALPLPLGVLGHEGSTVLVCLNGLRLLFHRS
ncbi:MAG: heavy metal translocating P-type ATPase [Vulcanimicrobiota bacterium]